MMTINIRVVLAIATLCLIGSPTRGFGHGTPITVNVVAGKLSIGGALLDDRGYADKVFADPDEEAVFSPGPNNRLIAALPGFEVFDMSAGQQLWIEALARPDFTKPATPARWLWYSDSTGNEVTDIPAALKLDLSSSRGFTPSVSMFQSTAPAVGSVKLADLLSSDIESHKHLLNYILNDLGAATGTYGFFARLTSPDYSPSDPFLLTLNNGLDPETFQKGAKRINAAARLPVDYDGDEDVDGGDLLAWQRTLGSTAALAADGSVNDIVDAADLGVWRDNFGRVTPTSTPAAGAIPEPNSLVLAIFVGGLLAAARQCDSKTA
jgi:hypothetical protein